MYGRTVRALRNFTRASLDQEPERASAPAGASRQMGGKAK
jgi:hypothetical protein